MLEAKARAWSRFRVAAPLLLVAIVVAAGGLRYYQLGERSLWFDELTTAEATGLHSLGDVLAYTPSNRMPLDLVLVWGLNLLGLGDGDLAVRVPAAIAGTLLVAAVFLLARRLFGLAGGFVAAVAAAVSPFAVWYSQDASPYAVLMLFVTLQVWAADRAAEYGRLLDWLLFAVLTALALYTQPSDLLVTAALFAYLIFAVVRFARDPEQRRRQVTTRALAATTAVALALLSLALWPPAARALLAFLSGAGLASTTLPSSNLPTRLYWLFDGLSLGPLVILAALGLPLAARRAPVILFWLLIPLFALLVIRQGNLLNAPPLSLAGIWPALPVLAGGGACAIATFGKQRFEVGTAPVAAVLAIAVILLSAPGLVNWSVEPKDDWRSAADAIHSDRSAGVVLAMGAGSDRAVTSISHYLDRSDPALPVFDVGGSSGSPAGTDSVAYTLAALPGAAWAVFQTDRGSADLRAEGRSATGHFPGPATVPRAFSEIDLVGVTLVRGPNPNAVLDWGATLFPAVRATAALTEKRPTTTIAPPTGEAGPFHLVADGRPVERLWVKKAEPSVAMVARFQCKAIGNAEAYVYVSAGDARGRSIGLYPDQGGYGCQGGTGAFAFATPPGTTQVKLRVRVTGHGSADFSDLNLGVVGGP